LLPCQHCGINTMTSSSVPPASATSMAINTVALSVSLLAAWLLLGAQ